MEFWVFSEKRIFFTINIENNYNRVYNAKNYIEYHV